MTSSLAAPEPIDPMGQRWEVELLFHRAQPLRIVWEKRHHR